MATQYGSRYGQEYGYGPYSGTGSRHGDTGSRRHRLPAGLRAPFEARSWREFGYVLLGLPIGILLFTYAVTMGVAGAGLLVTFLGIPVLAAGLAGCRGFGVLERAR
ncbi:sensor domain-containing protein, partial [Streptomyces carpinensis]